MHTIRLQDWLQSLLLNCCKVCVGFNPWMCDLNYRVCKQQNKWGENKNCEKHLESYSHYLWLLTCELGTNFQCTGHWVVSKIKKRAKLFFHLLAYCACALHLNECTTDSGVHKLFLTQSIRLAILLFTDYYYYYNNVQLKLPSYVPVSPFLCTRLLPLLHFVWANILVLETIKYATASQFVVFLPVSPFEGKKKIGNFCFSHSFHISI